MDKYAWFSSTQYRTNFHKVQDVPPNSQILSIFKQMNSEWRRRRDLIIYINFHTSSSAAEIKRSHSFGHLKGVGVRAWRDMWQTDRFKKIGWISHVQHNLSWIGDVQEQITNGLVSQNGRGLTNPYDVPRFSLQSEQRAFGNGANRVYVECLAIVTTIADANVLKRRFSELYHDQKMPGVWCPVGIHLKEGPEKYLKLLRKHKNFVKDISHVSVFGIWSESLKEKRTTSTGRTLSLIEYIKASTGAIDVARISRSTDLGKFNLIFCKQDLDATRLWIHKQLPQV